MAPNNSGDSLRAGIVEEPPPILYVATEEFEPGQILGDRRQQQFRQPLYTGLGRRLERGVKAKASGASRIQQKNTPKIRQIVDVPSVAIVVGNALCQPRA